MKLLKRQQRLLISILLFIAVILIFTRVDYLIHSDFYEHGLLYEEEWFWTSQILYFLMYQVAIAVLFLYSRSLRLLMIFEAFVCTGGMDLVGFFLIWNGGAFPGPDVVWTWNLLYALFGFRWTTAFNVWLTSVATGITTFAALYFNPDKGRL